MEKVFQLLNEMVREGELSNYAIGGAIAAVFYVRPFATQDVDVFVTMQTGPTGLVTKIPGWDYLKERGYTEIRDEGIMVEGWPVQFLPVSSPLQEEAFLNATIIDTAGEPVRVILAEHLVALMLQSGRLKDVVRVQMFLEQDAVDQEVLLDIIKRHGLEKQWANFQSRYLP